MSNSLLTIQTSPGLDLVAVIRRSTDEKIWNMIEESFETFNETNLEDGDYDVFLTEQGTSGYYVGSFPEEITQEGRYNVVIYSLTEYAREYEAAGPVDWTTADTTSLPVSLSQYKYVRSTYLYMRSLLSNKEQ